MAHAYDSEAQLFDYLQKHFGVGDWDELANCDKPYWKYRNTEISKIKASRLKRQVALIDMYIAGEFCLAHRIDIRNAVWLYSRIHEAKKWWATNAEPAAEVADFEDLYEAAIQIEFGISASPWLDRMFRAEGRAREEVYAAWSAARATTSESSPTPARSAGPPVEIAARRRRAG